MINAFPLVMDWTVWCIRNGKSIRIFEEPKVNSSDGFKITDELVSMLHDHGIFSLWEARARGFNLTRCSVWQAANDLELEGELTVDWAEYTRILSSNFIRL